MAKKRRGDSYRKRCIDINRIYDEHIKSGLSNREIWRRYIYPQYRISERTLYNLLNASVDQQENIPEDMQTLFDFTQDYETADKENTSRH